MTNTTSPSMNTKDLIAQLDAINKQIFEQAIIENKGRYKMADNIVALDNLEVNAIENDKIISRIKTADSMIAFYQNGGNITKCKTVVSKRMKRLYNV